MGRCEKGSDAQPPPTVPPHARGAVGSLYSRAVLLEPVFEGVDERLRLSGDVRLLEVMAKGTHLGRAQPAHQQPLPYSLASPRAASSSRRAPSTHREQMQLLSSSWRRSKRLTSCASPTPSLSCAMSGRMRRKAFAFACCCFWRRGARQPPSPCAAAVQAARATAWAQRPARTIVAPAWAGAGRPSSRVEAVAGSLRPCLTAPRASRAAPLRGWLYRSPQSRCANLRTASAASARHPPLP